jgi:hypothetical protein
VSTEGKGDGRSKAAIGLISAFAGIVLGFLVGIVTDQTKEFVERADSCYQALVQHELGMQKVPRFINDMSDHQDVDRFNAAAAEWNNDVVETARDVSNKCPIDPAKPEYLDGQTVKQFQALSAQVQACEGQTCDVGGVISLKDMIIVDVRDLQTEANKVKDWGLVRRCRYAVTHLY